jgi:HEAT repeat protein
MPILIEHITELVFTILLIVLLADGALIAIAIARRQRREKYFQRIDELRARYAPVIAALLAQKLDYARGLALLEDIGGLDRDYVLEQLCISKAPNPAQVPILRQLAEDLGLVRVWQRQLSGQMEAATLRETLSRPEGIVRRVRRLGFLLRAKAAENLGVIRHQPSWLLLVDALDDSHPDVRTVAMRSLAAIVEPRSFPAIVERLHRAILDPANEVSLRLIKSGLVNFPLAQAAGLLPSLQHSNPRIRFFATDVIREMVERQAAPEEEFLLDPKVFSPDLLELFLTKLCFDPNPDVRARATPVIAHLGDPRSAPVLLALLEDREWFVRLHTVRALAKRRYLPQAAEISRRLSDSHWMVREASARTLLVFGRVGTAQLSTHFLNSGDRYSREQIADEIQRSGLIPTLLAQYGNEVSDGSAEVIGQLAEMGKTSYMLAVLQSSSDRNLRKKFLEGFGGHRDPRIRAWVRGVARREPDPELRALAQTSLGTGG